MNSKWQRDSRKFLAEKSRTLFNIPANSKQIEFALTGLSEKQRKWKSMN
jgi:hypothetical protein